MPKENINSDAGRDWRVEVTWSPDKYVQVATVYDRSAFTLPGDSPDEPEQRFFGWHVTLDRDGINRTIRALKRARDAAFGRDE